MNFGRCYCDDSTAREARSRVAGLEPNIDAYGTYGYASALADWLELCALAGQRQTQADVADLIRDNGWGGRRSEQYYGDVEDYDRSAPDMTSAAYELIDQRSSTLGARYPFERNHEGVLRSAGGSYNPYVSLLSITVAHAWSDFAITGAASPENVLEHVVAEVLRDRNFRVAQMGAMDQAGGGFAAALSRGAAAVGLKAMPRPVPVAISARDAGVDTLAALPWEDGRPGQWTFIGQVTCAKTDQWEGKLDRPKASNWRNYLLELNSPFVFLAVPHHVENRHLRQLLSSDRGVVLDRLRLATHEAGVSQEERVIIDAVLAVGVDDGKAARATASSSTGA